MGRLVARLMFSSAKARPIVLLRSRQLRPQGILYFTCNLNATVQARAVPLLIAYAALAALNSVVYLYATLDDPNSHPQVLQLQHDAYSSMSSAQSKSTVVFDTNSNDQNPVTAVLTTS